VSYCSIESIDLDAFESLSNLKDLCLDSNKLVGLKFKFVALKQLSLASNSLVQTDYNSMFINNERELGLEELCLSQNEIVKFESGTFREMKSLRKLWIRERLFFSSKIKKCEISVRAFEGLSNLEELCISIDNFSCLEEGVFSSLSSLKCLTISAKNHGIITCIIYVANLFY
jgi:Leucine-rich repeat (LRR) protein